MKLEIKTNEKGYCDYFKINGRKFGNGITGCTVFINAEGLPTALIETKLNEFILDSENCKLYLDNTKKENIFKRIINKLKRGTK